MSAIQTLQEVNDNLSTDDAPLWAEVLGVVLALGFFTRDNAHVLSALIADEEPQLRGQDVTRRSPVASLDDNRSADISARLFALSLGILLAHIAMLASSVPVAIFIGANALVPLADPILYASIHNS